MCRTYSYMYRSWMFGMGHGEGVETREKRAGVLILLRSHIKSVHHNVITRLLCFVHIYSLALGRVLVVPYFFHLRIMEVTVQGTFNPADIFVAFLRFVPQTNPVSELYRQFLWLGFCSDMHFQLLDLI